jgi:hypothetical protein
VEVCVNVGRVDDVEGGNGEREGGCLDAAADDYLSFVGEADLCFVLGGKFRRQYFVEDGAFCVIGFYGFAAHGAADEIPLILGEVSRGRRKVAKSIREEIR